MSRRNNFSISTREPATALSGHKLAGCLRAIRAMRDKQIALAKQPFTMAELIDLFVEPRHHAPLLYVYDLVEPSGMTSTLNVRVDTPPHLVEYMAPVHAARYHTMKFSWYGRKEGGFYVPEKQGSEESTPAYLLEEYALAANVEKYRQVEQDLLDIQHRFCLAEKVVHHLNLPANCKTLPQMRYVWPAITVLLSKGGFKDDAAALAEPSARAGDKVVLSDWLTKHVKETNDTIVRAVMLDDVPVPTEKLPVEYYLLDQFETA